MCRAVGRLWVCTVTQVMQLHSAETVTAMQTNDACFDKTKILYEGEKYVDPSRCGMLAVTATRQLVHAHYDRKAKALWPLLGEWSCVSFSSLQFLTRPGNVLGLRLTSWAVPAALRSWQDCLSMR
jgi:hypothetical protein